MVPSTEITEEGGRIAGRLVARRGGGKAMFLDLADRAGRMQLRVVREEVGDESFDRLKKQVDLGDLIGVDGELFIMTMVRELQPTVHASPTLTLDLPGAKRLSGREREVLEHVLTGRRSKEIATLLKPAVEVSFQP